MRSVRHADVCSLPNLLSNGAFDFVEDVAGTPTAHFWTGHGVTAATNAAATQSVCGLVRGETIVDAEGASDYVRFDLLSGAAASWRQSFLADPAAHVLDFPTPLAPGSARREMAPGFLSRFRRTLARSRSYTAALSARVVRGAATLSARFLDADGGLIASADLTARADSGATGRRWKRYSATLTPAVVPSAIEFVAVRTGGEIVELHLSLFQLVLGAYDEAPYTGDPLVAAVPADAIVLALGSVCPPGFVALEEPAGAVPAAWLAADPTLKLRRGAFPLGATKPDTAPHGAPTHNRTDGYQFEVAADDVVEFESFDSTWGSAVSGSVSYNPNVRTPADEPDDRGRADHQHNVREGGSLPAHRRFLFCRRL